MMQQRMVYLGFHIDTNLLNSRQKLDHVNQLEEWSINGLIQLNISHTALEEALKGDNPSRTRKAYTNIFTDTTPISESDPRFITVATAIFPGSTLSENQKNDVRIICEAAKYAAILVTNDGASASQPWGILGNRHKLKKFVEILNPEEAVNLVREKIQERDDFNRECARISGAPLPTWTGQD